ncbi:hypothetical protein ACFE04_017843 [Oxalis oulophora]
MEFIRILILLNVMFFSCISSSHGSECPPPTKKHHPVATCPKDTLKLGACGSWLGLVYEVVGTPPSEECCTVLKGIADLEAAVCLCTAIKANVLGVLKVEVPVAISLLLNACGKKIPKGFVC